MIRKFIATSIFSLTGWKGIATIPTEKKFVLIGAPHTSNWDLPIALLFMWKINKQLKWVAKKQIFRGPVGWFFKALGGIPVDRSAPHGLIEDIAGKINQQNEFIFGITPEGTRSYTSYWKTGFYYIALTAKIPIVLGYIDFPSKTIGFDKVLYPSGDINRDFEIIADFYADKTGKFPELQGPVTARQHPRK